MKLLKFLTKSIFVSLIVLGSTSFVFAETAPAKSNTIVLAKINAQNGKVVSQEGDKLNLSFSISNREGAQSGVRYGIRLEKMQDKKGILIDERVYDEVLSIGANSVIDKNIEYIAPANLEGKYNLYVSLKNYSGLPLVVKTILGEVSLSTTKDLLEMQSDSCSVSSGNISSGKINQNILVEKTNDLFLNCKVKNTSKEKVEIKPAFETFYGSIYGEKVEQSGGKYETFSFAPLEEKTISFVLPKANTPQNYVTKVSFEKGKIASNYVLVNYTLSGVSATIRNISLDKNSYKAKEVARLALFWSSSLKRDQATNSVSLNANIVNDKQAVCASLENKQLASVGFVEIPVTLNKNCENPKVAVELKDLDGNILDKKSLVFEGAVKMSKAAPIERRTLIIFGAFALLVVLASAVAFIRIKSKKDETEKESNNMGPTLMAILFLIGLALVPSGFAKADTYLQDTGTNQLILTVNVPTNLSVNESFDVYADLSCEGDEISCLNYYSAVEVQFPLDSTNYGPYVLLFNDHVSAGVGLTGVATGTAPSVAGSYAVKVFWDVFGTPSGHRAHPYVGSVGFSVTPPPLLNVYARVDQIDYEDSVTVNSGKNVTIVWTILNVPQGKACTCTYGTGQTCGSSNGPYGLASPFQGQTFPLTSTTTYTVNCP